MTLGGNGNGGRIELEAVGARAVLTVYVKPNHRTHSARPPSYSASSSSALLIYGALGLLPAPNAN